MATIKTRKTILVSQIRDKANKFFLESSNENTQGRLAMITFLENLLHDTGNYRGFGYLDKKDVMTNSTYGIDFPLPESERFLNTDSTRVFYY